MTRADHGEASHDLKDPSPEPPRYRDDVAQVAPEVLVHPGRDGGVGSHLLLKEHPYAAPLLRRTFRGDRSDGVSEELPQPRGVKEEAGRRGAGQSQRPPGARLAPRSWWPFRTPIDARQRAALRKPDEQAEEQQAYDHRQQPPLPTRRPSTSSPPARLLVKPLAIASRLPSPKSTSES
jgi:hypothetical protein